MDMMPAIAEREECDVANAYLTLIHDLTLEAKKAFPEPYYGGELEKKAISNLRDLRERCGIQEETSREKMRGC